MAQIKLTGASPGLKLLGFKPISAIRPEHNVTHSTFAFPNDYVSSVYYYKIVFLYIHLCGTIYLYINLNLIGFDVIFFNNT